ncbi:hypothetical protein [Aureimonas leprariae]|uniref:Uncharacterized protein n=1 Tax=Plantimonas leprariae TaxID=2615207 RepID=A0A7V7PQ13_9HYPH|nr:hypothetical protein [Aureimonas leprariae]KAB0680182.1 hypothetical protein F6X38_08305 [Aureimonas leprariae]
MGEKGLALARAAGRFVGSDLTSSANMCPWQPGKHRHFRDAWLAGFGEGRVARLWFKDEDWPAIEISLEAFKKAVD